MGARGGRGGGHRSGLLGGGHRYCGGGGCGRRWRVAAVARGERCVPCESRRHGKRPRGSARAAPRRRRHTGVSRSVGGDQGAMAARNRDLGGRGIGRGWRQRTGGDKARGRPEVRAATSPRPRPRPPTTTSTHTHARAQPPPHPLSQSPHHRYAQLLRVWLAQFRQTSELRSREKNWSPFSWRGGVYLEYSLQPRLVLALNRRTGVCSPVLPLTSSAGVQAWLDKLGPASGGPPSVLPNVEGVLAVPQLTTLACSRRSAIALGCSPWPEGSYRATQLALRGSPL